MLARIRSLGATRTLSDEHKERKMGEELVVRLEEELAWKEREIDRLTACVEELTKVLNITALLDEVEQRREG